MVKESWKKVDPALLLWRSLARQPEYRMGALHLNPEITIRTFKNQKARYLEAGRFEFILAMKELLKPVSQLENEKMEYLIFRSFDAYQKEVAYSQGSDTQFSIDIVFQFIEFLCQEKTKEDITSLLQKETSLEKKEVDSIIQHIKAFNKLGAYFTKVNHLKKTIENGEQIIAAIATAFPEITWLALESMFYLLVAQHALASKYSCESLLKGWMNEYGFDENQYVVVANFFPPGTSLLDFSGRYTEAIRTLIRIKEKERPEYDLLLLRSIGNYFSSWIVKVAHQMETDLQTA
ncbi:hypothetical protein LPTSP4_00840 [Leptospira ryugenii]|uniref:Uncharacterized protein n=1 Tax=Leptospira ryugenii TaxID=1917863 RepID=A0A2P2DVE9_9LEPT|nr:hypothetical protein [Leptospira ryugenii]GBF48585.1 hypothetical protein LPTSP4_00840 [Leptospira ryugenii]